jgi:hypothetical protein
MLTKKQCWWAARTIDGRCSYCIKISNVNVEISKVTVHCTVCFLWRFSAAYFNTLFLRLKIATL